MTMQRQLLDSHFESRIANSLHTAFPAEVININSQHSVDVQPLVETLELDGKRIPYPILYNVRMLTLIGASGSLGISIPVKIGSRVLVVVSERDTASLVSFNQVKATTTITHDLSDCFAIPYFFTDADAPTIDTENVVVFNKSTKLTVKSDSVEIEAKDIKIKGDVDITGQIKNNGFNIGNTHTHTTSGVISSGVNPS